MSKQSAQKRPETPKPAKRKRPYHHGDLRAALIEAALKLIAQHGVKGFALSDAARAAGVSVAAPYRHFTDKEMLLVAIAEEGFVMFRDALAQAAQSQPEDRRQRLVVMGLAYVEFAVRHRSHFKVMWEGGISKDDYPTVGTTAYQSFQLLEGAASSLLPKASIDQQRGLVCAAWSVVHGYASLAIEGELEGLIESLDDNRMLLRSLHLLVDQFA